MNNKTMTLITFSVNTENSDTTAIASGMSPDGSYTLTHVFKQTPPPDAEYTIKHVYINTGQDGPGFSGRQHKPGIWVDFHFPQLEDKIIATQKSKRYTLSVTEGRHHTVDSGVIRFPITTYPVNGENNAIDSNAPGRADDIEGTNYAHAGTHVCNVPVGRMRVDDNVMQCVVRPLAHQDLQLVDADNAIGSLWPRVRNLQVILEYK